MEEKKCCDNCRKQLKRQIISIDNYDEIYYSGDCIMIDLTTDIIFRNLKWLESEDSCSKFERK